jgi:hypothetical protein
MGSLKVASTKWSGGEISLEGKAKAPGERMARNVKVYILLILSMIAVISVKFR